MNLTMSEWDALSDDDRDWALADTAVCPLCGGDDPERVCQNPAYQHAWEVKITRCYKSRAIQMAMERFKNDPYLATFIPHVTLNLAKAKPMK